MTSPTQRTAEHAAVNKRVLRRETHSPRSGLAITLAIVLILVLAWIATECVLAALSRPALLVAPGDGVTAITRLPEAILPQALVAAGVIVALIGLVILLFAVLPGRRARHVGAVNRTVVVVDNSVIAAALARAVSYRASVDVDQVLVTVGRRTADVAIEPSSGFPLDRAAIATAVNEQLDGFALTPPMRSKVVIRKKGKVGA